MMIGLPQVNISFKTAAESFNARAGRGIVGLILKDENESVKGVHEIKKANEIPVAFDSKNKAYIERALIGYVNPPLKVVVYSIADTAANLAVALEYFTSTEVDYIAGPHDCSPAEALEIANWVKKRRAEDYAEKATLPNQAADCDGVINFTTGDIVVYGAKEEKLTAAEYCSRIAGVLAGTPLDISCTYAPLPEVTSFKKLSKADMNTAINNGELILYHDGQKTKIARGVNSYKTIAPGKNESFRKIKTVAVVDAIRKDLKRIIQDQYIGKMPNSYDDKCILMTAIKEYFTTLEDMRVLQKGASSVSIDMDAQRLWLSDHGIDDTYMSEQEIKEHLTGDKVYLKANIKMLDAMEDIDLGINC